MADSITPEYHHYAPPSPIPIPPSLTNWFALFYALSDNSSPSSNPTYVAQFLPDAKFVIGAKAVQGTDAIRTAREGMWTKISARKHTVSGIYPLSSWDGDENVKDFEVMLRGTVGYTLKADGSTLEVEWAARAIVAAPEGHGKWKFRHYQIYMDSAPVAEAVAKAEKWEKSG